MLVDLQVPAVEDFHFAAKCRNRAEMPLEHFVSLLFRSAYSAAKLDLNVTKICYIKDERWVLITVGYSSWHMSSLYTE